MIKFFHGVCDGLSIAELAARVACFAAGAFFFVELAALAAKYGALIQYAMRGHAVY